MKFWTQIAALGVAGLIAAAPATATLLTFDDISVANGGQQGLGRYGGFTWSNTRVQNGTGISNGYTAGIVSPANAIFNNVGAIASFSSSTPFTFNSGYFTSAFSTEMATVTGYVGGVQTYQSVFQITNSPTLVTFDWANLSKVSWIGGDGTPGTHVVLDNLTVNESSAVPEPATWAMMIGGFGMIGGALRRQRKAILSFG